MLSKFNSQIIWEKWVDPFGENMDEAQWNNYDNEEDDADGYPDMQPIKGSGKPIRVISSPMGLIPYNEYTSSAKIFNYWEGHTNFNLCSDIVSQIEKCEGIEIRDIFTRYRFRIAVGKCFADSDVMKSINDIAEKAFNENLA
jgi:hypothetical protein